MNKKTVIIKEKKEFNIFQSLINQIIIDGFRLPNQVFQPPLNKFVFEEFDWSMSAEFWETIQSLALQSADSYVLMAVIEPNPIDYFYKEFGYYSWFKIPTTSSTDDYWSILELEPEGSPADAVVFNSDVVVWVSPSKSWAIWGERSHGVCVLATRNELDQLQLSTWRTVDKAINELIPLQYTNKKVPEDFSDLLTINYFNKQSSF
ncbi:hypothetical protein [Paenibacillus lemnae]|uniref:Uncharacterized protein n=1 Tax=Paenibacillus lemnae TaxID=1330551 RepID=A0A848M2Y1_PAELE|nr:hypothetical protein [Paenibacillus lemnae]NMO94916.1 hypothetical protein [Paenibacillus lemnae]